jgi:hypothetical protein
MERIGGRGGLIGEVLMAIYSREINGGITLVTVSETERGRGDCGEDKDDRWGPGVREREEGCVGWAGSAGFGPGCGPGWAAVLFSIFFFCFLFLLFLISVLDFEKAKPV